MKDDSVKRILLIASFALFAIAMVFVSYYIMNYVNGNGQYFQSYNKVINNELAGLLIKQKNMDDKIKDIVANGDYTFESPCVIVNPYEINPLSALIIFSTKEKNSVEIYINDTKVTTMEASVDHVIPVYGLYANSTNYIELRLNDGKRKVVEVKTSAYNDDLTGIRFNEDRVNHSHVFMVGNTKSSNSILRGFDSLDNLILIMDFGYFGSFKLSNTLFHVGYNSEFSKNTNLQDIELQIDFMGRIIGIDKDTSDLTVNPNAEQGDKLYIYNYKNLYTEITKNYTTNRLVDTTAYSVETKIETNEIEEKLVNAEVYNKDYKIAVNGEYITYEFYEENRNMELLLVTRNSKYTYMYDITNRNIIKTSITGDLSIFIKKGDEYYSLLTTVKN